MKLWLPNKAGKKFQGKRKERFWDVDRDSVESDTGDELSDSLRPIEK